MRLSTYPDITQQEADTMFGTPPDPGTLGPTFALAKPPSPVYTNLPNGYGGNSTSIYRQEPPIQYPDGADIYVNGTTGNDSTGNGTLALPYKTITKGLSAGATANPAGNFRVLVAAGTYGNATSPEAANRWVLAGNFANWVSVETLSGEQDVIVIDNESAGTNTGAVQFRGSTVRNLQIRNFQFQSSGIANNNCCFSYNPSGAVTCTNLQFVTCIWQGIINSTAGFYCNQFGATDTACNGVSFIGCNYTSIGAGTFNPRVLACQTTTLSTTNQPFVNLGYYRNIIDPAATYDAWGITIEGTTNFVAVGNVTNCKLYGFLLGQDTTGPQSGNPVPANTNYYVAGNSFTGNNGASTTGGHGAILGNASNSGIFEFNVVTGSVQGAVVKSSTGTSLASVVRRRNFITLTGANALGSGLQVKASTYVQDVANDVYCESTSQAGSGYEEEYDSSVPSIKSGNSTLVGNYLVVDGASMALLEWQPALQSTGGAASNYNVYEERNSAGSGNIRATAVTTLASIQTAWGSAGLTGDLATNDSNSQFNTAGSRADVTFTGLASTLYYAQYIWADGRQWTGIAIEAYNPATQWRFAFYLLPTTLGGTSYARPNPFNLSAGSFSVIIRQQLGAIANADDPIVSGPTALSYAS